MHVPESLVAMPRFVEQAVAAADAEGLARRGPGGTFSLTEQACHLRDLEREGYLVRVRRILAEETPTLAGFDGDAVARERDYPAQDAFRAARDFSASRAELVALLRSVDGPRAQRTAMFGGQRITLAGLVGMIEDHDRGHRDEIAALSGMEAS
jgi:hypothetical protein